MVQRVACVLALGCGSAQGTPAPVTPVDWDQAIRSPRLLDDESPAQSFPIYGDAKNWTVGSFFRGDEPSTDRHFWILHPPLAFARNALGEAEYARCVDALRLLQADACTYEQDGQRLRIDAAGSVYLWMSPERSFDKPRVQILRDDKNVAREFPVQRPPILYAPIVR